MDGGDGLPAAGVMAATNSRPPQPRAAVDFLQKAEKALDDVVTLRVTTLVGAITVTGIGTDAVVGLANPADGEAMMTEINLLTGKIANVVSPAFATGALLGMQPFHSAQVEKSQQIVAGNLAELQKLAMALLTRK